MALPMRGIAVVLACLVPICSGRRVHTKVERIQGSALEERSSQKAFAGTFGSRSREAFTVFARLLLAFNEPLAGWQLNAHSGHHPRSRTSAPMSRMPLTLNTAVEDIDIEEIDIESDSSNDATTVVNKGGKEGIVPERAKNKVPHIAIVGHGNVGKSTIANWMTGKKGSMVYNFSGITRDRVSVDGEWNGRKFRLIDTGGLVYNDAVPFAKGIREQTMMGIKEADAVLFVVDGKEGRTSTDEYLAEALRESRETPVILAVNKVDFDDEGDVEAADFWQLGLGTPFPVSGLYPDWRMDELMRELFDVLPSKSEAGDEAADGDLDEVSVALLGRPNVGKSSLLNSLMGEDVMIVSEIQGTTRDAVEHSIRYNGTTFTFIDTAGIRSKTDLTPGVEERMVKRSLQAAERADVSLIIVDGKDGKDAISPQERFFARHVINRGHRAVVVVNKWDIAESKLIDKHKRMLKADLEQICARISLKSRKKTQPLYISALTGMNVYDVFEAVRAQAEDIDRGQRGDNLKKDDTQAEDIQAGDGKADYEVLDAALAEAEQVDREQADDGLQDVSDAKDSQAGETQADKGLEGALEKADDDLEDESKVEDSAPDDSQEYSITLDRSGGENLGVVVDNQDGVTLLIGDITEGLVSHWNEEHPDVRVRVGDRIVSVNNVRGDSTAMLEEIKQSRMLEVTLQKKEDAPMPAAPKTEVYDYDLTPAAALAERYRAQSDAGLEDDQSRITKGGLFNEELAELAKYDEPMPADVQIKHNDQIHQPDDWLFGGGARW